MNKKNEEYENMSQDTELELLTCLKELLEGKELGHFILAYHVQDKEDEYLRIFGCPDCLKRVAKDIIRDANKAKKQMEVNKK